MLKEIDFTTNQGLRYIMLYDSDYLTEEQALLECDFIEPKWSKWRNDESRYLDSDDGYIDHCCEFYPLMDELFADEELLVRYLSGAVVYTGNDNCDDDRIDEIIEDYESRGYYVYEKGN